MSFFLLMLVRANAEEYSVSSPNGKINVSVSVDNELKWSASVERGNLFFSDNEMALELSDEILGVNPKVKSANKSNVSETVTAIVPVKSKNYREQLQSVDIEVQKRLCRFI